MSGSTVLASLKRERDEKLRERDRLNSKQYRALMIFKKAQESLAEAYTELDDSYHAHQAKWEEFKQLRDRLSEEINQISQKQRKAIKRMRKSSKRASQSHSKNGGLTAQNHAHRAYQFKSESENFVKARSDLIRQIHAKQAEFESFDQALTKAKKNFDAKKAEYAQAKLAHNEAKERLSEAQRQLETAEAAVMAYHTTIS